MRKIPVILTVLAMAGCATAPPLAVQTDMKTALKAYAPPTPLLRCSAGKGQCIIPIYVYGPSDGRSCFVYFQYDAVFADDVKDVPEARRNVTFQIVPFPQQANLAYVFGDKDHGVQIDPNSGTQYWSYIRGAGTQSFVMHLDANAPPFTPGTGVNYIVETHSPNGQKCAASDPVIGNGATH